MARPRSDRLLVMVVKVTEKTCSKCGRAKLIGDFRLHRRIKRGTVEWAARCKDCEKEYFDRKRADPERAQRIRDMNNALYRQRGGNRHQLMNNYGLTLDEWDAMYEKQEGLCAICRKPQTRMGQKIRLSVDHDHATGKVRGLLCLHCNRAIGNMRDDPALLRRAADYLTNNSEGSMVNESQRKSPV